MAFAAVAALVIFIAVVLATVLLVLVPVRVPVPARCRPPRCPASLPLSYAWMPVVGTLLMLATGALDGDSFTRGIVGDERLKPYGIVILFMALAYMSSSLDMTGCFQWLALHLTRLSRGNGMALFLTYFTLSSVITVFSSNDVSIMALTPITLYCCLATKVDPIPFLTAEFTAANIWSMLLFVGNPTNIIVALAFKMGFFEYTKWMGLPTLGAGAAGLLAVLAVHARTIPKQLALPQLHPSAMLVDVPGAVLGSANILACLGLLAAAPALHWELWAVTLVCAVLHAMYNAVAYVLLGGRWCRRSAAAAPADAAAAAGAGAGAAAEHGAGAATATHGKQQLRAAAGSGAEGLELVEQPAGGAAGAGAARLAAAWQLQPQYEAGKGVACSPSDAQISIEDDPQSRLRSRTCSCQQLLSSQQALSDAPLPDAPSQPYCAVCRLPSPRGTRRRAAAPETATTTTTTTSSSGGSDSSEECGGLQPPPLPSFWHAVWVLPWEVVPFVLGMFCVVEGLNANGWVDALALALAGGLRGSVWAAVLGVGGVSLLLANIINNQPMTILMTRVVMSPAFTRALSSSAAGAGGPAASAFAVIVASNTAANFSVMGALAGIMFVNILQQRGLKGLGYGRFSLLMMPAGLASTLAALLVLGAEFATWPAPPLTAAH